jgi:hypothetical protein
MHVQLISVEEGEAKTRIRMREDYNYKAIDVGGRDNHMRCC